jgi:hypothetical protein
MKWISGLLEWVSGEFLLTRIGKTRESAGSAQRKMRRLRFPELWSVLAGKAQGIRGRALRCERLAPFG